MTAVYTRRGCKKEGKRGREGRKKKGRTENHKRVSTPSWGLLNAAILPWQLYLAPSNLMAAVIHLYPRFHILNRYIYKENFPSFFFARLKDVHSELGDRQIFIAIDISLKRLNGFTRQLFLFTLRWDSPSLLCCSHQNEI